MGHGMKAFSNTSIACRSGCIDMREAHFHIKPNIYSNNLKTNSNQNINISIR